MEISKNPRKTFFFRYLFFTILLVSFLFLFHSSCNKERPTSVRTFIIKPSIEVEPRFLITPWKEIIFSANNSEIYKLYSYKDSQFKAIGSIPRDVFYPFLFAGTICGLQDRDGDEKYISTNEDLNKMFGNKTVKTIYSFKEGYLFFVQLDDDDNVYQIDLRNNSKRIILDGVQELHKICFSEKNHFVVISYNNKLTCFNLNKEKNRFDILSGTDSNTDKFNPFIKGDEIYFSSNYNSEFYRIFKTKLEDSTHRISLVYESNYDVLMPKIIGDNLFFIEVINNQYLLQKYNTRTGIKTPVTNKGVVYNYDFYDSNNVIFAYSDFSTPKCLMKYNELDRSLVNLTCKSLKLDLSVNLSQPQPNRSQAYIISPLHIGTEKGVVLFFHQGFHGDFSPRWETTLINLALNGYIIIAPNYPMSFGLGKSYYNSDFANSLEDIQSWKKFISKRYSSLPIYYLSSSSGNVLMEESLVNDNKNISASVSLFGMPGKEFPEPQLPSLYILGQKDPIIDFGKRNHDLELAKKNNSNVFIVSYPDEGHWLRKSKNQENAIDMIIDFYRCHN